MWSRTSWAARDHREDSDLDLYIEADGAPEDAREAPAVPSEHFNVMIVPSGTLLANARVGEVYATAFAHDALVAEDTGAFRETLVTLDEALIA